MAETESESADGGTPIRRMELSVKKKGRQNKVIVEQFAAEGLPPGWIKEIKMRMMNGRLRKDPYYTDPKTGYIFRSFKDASRYVKTGELGRLACKPNETVHDEVDPKDDENRSPAETAKVEENKIDERRKDEDLELHEPKKDEKINRYVRSSKRKGSVLDENASENDTSLAVPEDESPERTVAAKHSKRSKKIVYNDSRPSTRSAEKRVTRSQSRGKKDDDDNREEKRENATDDSKRQAKKNDEARKNTTDDSKCQRKKDDENRKNATDDGKRQGKNDDKNGTTRLMIANAKKRRMMKTSLSRRGKT